MALPPHYQAAVDSTKCTYRQLGKSGLKVSVPILGAMGFGNKDWVWPWVHNEEEVRSLMPRQCDKSLFTPYV
jgi:hypothetical protein